jgi:hypothetical protein
MVRRIALVDRSSSQISFEEIRAVAQALQIQLDRDFSPLWGITAQVVPFRPTDHIPAALWPIAILDNPQTGMGVHLDSRGRPYAEVEASDDWPVTASHEMMEMLVDPLGHRFVSGPDLEPGLSARQVMFLMEVCDPCEVFEYTIGEVRVSDFVTPDYYNSKVEDGVPLDYLGRIAAPFEVPLGGYISWFDPQDQRWHQKLPDGSFSRASHRYAPDGSPRDDRDAAFDFDGARHSLAQIRAVWGGVG